MRAAAAARDPYVARRPLPACRTTPSLAVHVEGSTFHVCAAAATSCARTAAPAWRKRWERSDTVDLPAGCSSPLRWYGSHSVATTVRIADQGTSSSAARICACPVREPWPISNDVVTSSAVPSGGNVIQGDRSDVTTAAD